jgi:hypothetical protein
MKRFLALFALLALTLIAACADDNRVLLNYWRPISNPNVFLTDVQMHAKLNYDLAQCKCSNYPINVPHNEMAIIQPDMGRLAETGATKRDSENGCITTPGAVLIECMRTRGWEPTACSGRMRTPGGSQCAISIANPPDYPEEYPYHGPYDETFGTQGTSPAEQRQPVP